MNRLSALLYQLENDAAHELSWATLDKRPGQYKSKRQIRLERMQANAKELRALLTPPPGMVAEIVFRPEERANV